MVVTLYAVLLLSATIQGCASVEAGLPVTRLEPSQYPTFTDDYNLTDLREVINRNLVYLNRLDDTKSFAYGPDVYTVKHLKESLNDFLDALKHSKGDMSALNKHIRQHYAVYAYRGNNSPDGIIVTGYFVPTLKGSLRSSDTFRYPLYRPPQELNKVVPFLTRKEIDGGALSGRGLELLYVDDRVDLFFLHIQGSGVIELDTGDVLYVGYAGTNGHDYRSIGKFLMEENRMDNRSVSMQGIKAYLREHPEEMDRVMAHNPSYVFFTTTQEIGIGACNVPLVSGRAIATDLSIYPQGALSYISTKKAVLDNNDRITGYTPLTRFVINQDTGKAIVGPTRVDFFWGRGKHAEIQAGNMKQSGKLYFLVKKQPQGVSHPGHKKENAKDGKKSATKNHNTKGTTSHVEQNGK
ncbi:MAG: MltA domain-containing protein [Nitrospirae bacterium]|nr:MltA domain-containing protein [Nitrospirota bacterium]